MVKRYSLNFDVKFDDLELSVVGRESTPLTVVTYLELVAFDGRE